MSAVGQLAEGMHPVNRPTITGGPPPGKLDAGRTEDAPVPALRRRRTCSIDALSSPADEICAQVRAQIDALI